MRIAVLHMDILRPREEVGRDLADTREKKVIGAHILFHGWLIIEKVLRYLQQTSSAWVDFGCLSLSWVILAILTYLLSVALEGCDWPGFEVCCYLPR